MAPRFLTDFDPRYGELVDVAPGIRRIVARNPSKYTGWGTGTYVLGRGTVAVVDPGPDLPEHTDALLGALDGERVAHVLITHTHADHSPAARALVAHTGAITYGAGPHPRDANEEAEEHGDLDFRPDVVVAHGDVIEADDLRIECLATPGHISNHVCYADLDRSALFCGDHVMGWSTTVISPPDGDVAAYLDHLRLVASRSERTWYPTHGPAIADPRPYVTDLIEHRLERERQIVELLAAGPRTVAELVEVMYADVRTELHDAAARSVHAHLVKLVDEGRALVGSDGPTGAARYSAN